MPLDRISARARRASDGDNHARRPHATVVSLVVGIILALGLGATPALAAEITSPAPQSDVAPDQCGSSEQTTSSDAAPCPTGAAGEVTPQFSAEFAGPASTAVAAPALSVAALACDLLGASDLRVSASALGTGTFSVTATIGGAPVPGVASGTLTASAPTTILADLPNGATYAVVLADPSGRAVATTSVTLASCDLPTLDLPLDPQPVPGTIPAGTDPATVPTGTAPAQTGTSTTLAQTGQTVDQLIPLALGALLLGVFLSVAGVVIRRRITAD